MVSDNNDTIHSTGDFTFTEYKEKVPYKCPICEGRGIVPNGFYSIPVQQGTFTSNSTSPETCKGCGGTGVIYS